MQQDRKYKSMTRQELIEAYDVSYHVFWRWLKLIPNLNVKYKRFFTVKEVKMIFDHLGEPDGWSD